MAQGKTWASSSYILGAEINATVVEKVEKIKDAKSTQKIGSKK